MEIVTENLSEVDTKNVETYILGDLNKNVWQTGNYVFQKQKFAFMSFNTE